MAWLPLPLHKDVSSSAELEGMANVNVQLMEQRIASRKLLIHELGQAAATSEGHWVTPPDLPEMAKNCHS